MKGKFDKKCGYCSNEFKGRVNSVFCSTSCRSNHWQQNKKALEKGETFNKPKTKIIRKFYIAGKGHDSTVSCHLCKAKNEIGLFYLQQGNFRIKCDNCGLTYSMD